MRSLLVWSLPVLISAGAGSALADGRTPAEPPVQIGASDTVAEWNGLPAGPGREAVYGLCGACHSLMIVKQQGLNRDAWEETLVWMVEEQGMPELDADSWNQVLDYLAAHYGVHSRKKY